MKRYLTLILFVISIIAFSEVYTTLAGAYNTPDYAHGVYVSGNYAYVADADSGLQIINISDPSAPTLAGTCNTPYSAYGVYVSSNYAYVADCDSGLQIININDPSAPTLAGTYNTPDNAYGVYVSGNYAYVADAASGLQIININDPSAPTLAGTYNTPDNAYGVYVSGNYAYVADSFSGLQIINISDPSAPTFAGTYNTSGFAYGVYVSGNYAYVADADSGLQIININDPSAPTLAGTYNTPDYAHGVYVSGNYAYVADYDSGLQIINISDPSAPTLAGTYDTSGGAVGVYVSGNYAYVADGFSGLQIITSNFIPIISWLGTGNYTNDGVDPDGANRRSDFTFKITYTDSDNDSATISQVWIDLDDSGTYDAGEKLDMSEVDAGDIDVTDGKDCTYTRSIDYTGDGILNYKFYFKDVYSDATGEPTADHAFTVINNAPDLAWLNTGGYVGDGIDPDTGHLSETFSFKIKYTDIDEDPPKIDSVKLHVFKNSIEITNSPFVMAYESGNTVSGIIFYKDLEFAETGDDYSYYFEGMDCDNASDSTTELLFEVYNNAPAIDWEGTAGYTIDGVEPDIGHLRDTFVFRIVYSDVDEDPPKTNSVKLHVFKNVIEITNSPFVMDYESGDTVTGMVFTENLVFNETGNDYTYYFEVTDTYNASDTTATLNFEVYDNLPELLYFGTAGYASDGVDPDAGYYNETYTFKVKYRDLDNDAPLSGYPKVHLHDGASEISGSPFSMIELSSDHVNGSEYVFEKSLSPANYTYFFEAFDEYNVLATGINNTSFDLSVTNPYPSLFWTSETGYVSDGVEKDKAVPDSKFVFRVKYGDSDGEPPSYVYLNIQKGGAPLSGSPYSLSYISGDIATGAIYQIEIILDELGADYTYSFEAQDPLGVYAVGEATSMKEGPDVLSDTSVAELCNYPNPVSPGGDVTISYYLNDDYDTDLIILNFLGKEVHKQKFTAGEEGGSKGLNEILWNTRKDRKYLGTGIYYIVIGADGYHDKYIMGVKK
ncbi:hypothetical protein KAU32_00530 [bacterium]|nr:hypothetical protein [bacterium]